MLDDILLYWLTNSVTSSQMYRKKLPIVFEAVENSMAVNAIQAEQRSWLPTPSGVVRAQYPN
jgi:hypothetical protein